MARCPDCGEEARSGFAHGNLRFYYDLREPLPDHLRQRFSFGTTPTARRMLARFTYQEADDIRLVSVRFPAVFCDTCRHLRAARSIAETVPWDLCPECGGVLYRGAVFGSLHFSADGERLGFLCRLWRDFLRDTESRIVASYCRRCHRAYARTDTLTEVVITAGLPIIERF